jgi:putative flippase GtrA
MAEIRGETLWCDLRLLKFLMVGALNTVVGYSIYVLCLWAGLHYSAAIAVATVLGTLFNFKSTGSLVFRSHDNSLLIRFIAMYCAVYAVNLIGVGVLLQFGLAEWLSGLLLLLPLALLSYVLNSRFVFRS